MAEGMGVPYLTGWVTLNTDKAEKKLIDLDAKVNAVAKSIKNLSGQRITVNTSGSGSGSSSQSVQSNFQSMAEKVAMTNRMVAQSQHMTRMSALNSEIAALKEIQSNKKIAQSSTESAQIVINNNAKKMASYKSTVAPSAGLPPPSVITGSQTEAQKWIQRGKDYVAQQQAAEVEKTLKETRKSMQGLNKDTGFWNSSLGSSIISIGKMFTHMVAFQAISSTIFATWYKFWQIMREGVQLFLEMDKGVGRAMRTGLSPDEIKGYFGQGTKSIESSQGLGLGGAVAGNRKYVDTIREITTLQGLMFTSEHISSVKEYTEALYQLTSANIKMGSALQIIDDVMKVTIAAEGNITEVTKTLAGMYNIYKDTITDVTTEQQKFRSIANVVLYTWAKEQMELNDLNYSLKYVASSARAMGIDYKTLIATIGHLHTQMLRASTAGTGLRQVFNVTGQNATKLSGLFLDLNTQMRLFGMENAKKHMGAFDPSKPMDMVKAVGSVRDQLLELRKAEGRGNDDPFSLGELQKVIKNFSVRGSNVMLTLLNSYDSWKQKIQEVKDLHGDYIDQFVKLQELNLQDQMAILAKNIRSIPGAFLLGLENTKDMATALANINTHFKDVIITAYAFGKMAKSTWQQWAAGVGNMGENLVLLTARTIAWYDWLKNTVDILASFSMGNQVQAIFKTSGGSLGENKWLNPTSYGGSILETFFDFSKVPGKKETEIANEIRDRMKVYMDAFKGFSGENIEVPDFFGKTSEGIGDTKTAVEDLGVSFNVTGKKFEEEYAKQIDKVVEINRKLDEQNTLFVDQAELLANLNKQDENFNSIRESLLDSYGKKFEGESEKQIQIINKISEKLNNLNQNRLDNLQYQENKAKGGLTFNNSGQAVGVTNQAMIDALTIEINKRSELIKVKEIEAKSNQWNWTKGYNPMIIQKLQQEKKAYQELNDKLHEYESLKATLQGYAKGGSYEGDIEKDAKRYGVPTSETVGIKTIKGIVHKTKERDIDDIKNDIKKSQESKFKDIGKDLSVMGRKFAMDLKNNFVKSLDIMPIVKEKVMADIDKDAQELEKQYNRTFDELEKKLDFPGLNADDKKRKKFKLEFQTNLQEVYGSIQRIKDAIKKNIEDPTIKDDLKQKTNAVQVANLRNYEALARAMKKENIIQTEEMEKEIRKKYSDLSLSDEQKRLDAIRDKYKDMLKSSEGDLANHNKVVKAMEEELAQEKFKIEEELQKKIRDARQKTFDLDKQRADESFQLEATKAKKAFEDEWLKKFQDAKDKGASPAELQKLAKDYEAAKAELDNKLSKAQSEFAKQMGFQETINLTAKIKDVETDLDRLYKEYGRTKDKDYQKQIMDEINNKKRELEELKNSITAEANKMIGTEVEDTTRQIEDIIKKGTETDPEQRARNKKYEINTPGSDAKMILEKNGDGGSTGSTKGYVTGYANYYSKIDEINKKTYNQEITSLATLKNARDNRLNQLREEIKLKEKIERQKFGTDVAMSGTALNKPGGIWQTLSHTVANLTPQIMPKNIYDDPILKGLDRRINLKAQKQDTNINITVDGKKTTAGNATKIKEYAIGIVDEAVYSAMRGV